MTSKGGRGAKRSFNFQGRGSGSATSLPNPSAPASSAPAADAPATDAPAASHIPATYSPNPTICQPTAPAAAAPAASNIPAKFPCRGHPEPSASPLGSEGAGPSSAPNEPTGDTSHHVHGNSNSDSSSSSTQPLSGFSDLHSNYKTID